MNCFELIIINNYYLAASSNVVLVCLWAEAVVFVLDSQKSNYYLSFFKGNSVYSIHLAIIKLLLRICSHTYQPLLAAMEPRSSVDLDVVATDNDDVGSHYSEDNAWNSAEQYVAFSENASLYRGVQSRREIAASTSPSLSVRLPGIASAIMMNNL